MDMRVCILHARKTFRDQKKASDPLQLELYTAGIWRVGAGNQTSVLWNGSQCF